MSVRLFENGRPRTRIAVLLVLATGGGACHRPGQSSSGGLASLAPITVSVATAKVEDLRDSIVAQGTVVPNPTAIYAVIAPQPSKVVELPKPEGSKVETGDILARFDLTASTTELAAKTDDIVAATRKLELAKAEFEKQDALYAKGYTPRNTWTAAKAAVTNAQDALDQLNAQSKAVGALNDLAVARAPFAGIVLHVFKNVGDLTDAASNAAVLELVDPARVQVALEVTPSQELRIVPGQPATVTITGTSDTQPATVIVAPPVMGPQGAPTIEVRLSLTGPTPPPLGTAVSAEVIVDKRDHAVVIPEGALTKDDNGSFVMVAGADGRAHRRDVRPGLIAGHKAEILAGVTDGDEVIVGNLDQVSDSAAIQIDRGR